MPRLPQTSGMVIPKRGQKCFNDCIGDVLATTRFRSREDLQTTLECYLTFYNPHLPRKPLCHKALFQALRRWHADRPVTFHLSHPGICRTVGGFLQIQTGQSAELEPLSSVLRL